MDPLEQSVVQSMDGSTLELFPYLPYILQDLWELGADSGTILFLVRRHRTDPSGMRVLDLGCGKGAVSIELAAGLGCHCEGIDGIADFIAEAKAMAAERGVAEQCSFRVGDVRALPATPDRFDVIILAAIGPVFGDYEATLGHLSPWLAPGGIILLDDSYLAGEAAPDGEEEMLSKGEILRQAAAAGMQLLDEAIFDQEMVREANARMFGKLVRRCHELMEKHPEKAALFEDYIRAQEEENETLGTEAVSAVMVFGRV